MVPTFMPVGYGYGYGGYGGYGYGNGGCGYGTVCTSDKIRRKQS